MQKIPTVFIRDPENPKYVTDEVNPGCEWVLAGEGVPTRKIDGTCTMFDADGRWWARREVKPGKQPPPNYQPISTDPNTGKTVGWEPMEQSAFAKWHAEALEADGAVTEPGTYELIGPKVNGNPERVFPHMLVWHGGDPIHAEGMTPREIIELCRRAEWEGVVWHHPDGRMAKLKVRDYPLVAASQQEEN